MHGFLGAAFRSFAGRILSAISALIAAYSVTSHLSIEESGLFFLSLGFVIFLSHILRFGLDNFVLKKCSIFLSNNSYKDFLSIVVVSALLCVLGSAVLYLFLVTSTELISYEYTKYLLFSFPIAIIAALLGIMAHTLHASGFVFTGSITDTSLHYIIFSILIWLLAPLDAINAVQMFAVACCSALIIQMVIATILYKYRGIELSEWKAIRLPDVDYKDIFRTTIPLWLVVIAQQLNQWSAQFISSIYVEKEEIAILAIAMRIASLVPMVLNAVNMVVSPKFAAHHHNGETEQTRIVLAQSLKLLAIVASLVFLTIIIFGQDVLRIFGNEYIEASTLLSILVCGHLINALTGPCGKLLMMSGYEKDFSNTSIIVAAFGIAIGLYLTSQYGVYGAAIATAITISAQNIALALLVKHRLNIDILQIYRNILRKT